MEMTLHCLEGTVDITRMKLRKLTWFIRVGQFINIYLKLLSRSAPQLQCKHTISHTRILRNERYGRNVKLVAPRVMRAKSRRVRTQKRQERGPKMTCTK